jgi:copper(I)-binding protein
MKYRIFTTLIFAFILIACSPASVAKPLASQNGIEIYQPVVRLPGDATSGKVSNSTLLAGYMLIKNTGSVDDSLIGVQADFTGITMLHESSVDGNGVASMNMLTAINVPAGQTVELKPGGMHIMLVGLKQELKVGDKVTLKLQFQHAGAISVQAQVTNP